MKSVAIITARGGSKRIPHKNIKPFLGKPILEYSIEAALGETVFRSLVSTDDEEIARIARHAGGTSALYEKREYSKDYATTADVILEVLESYERIGKKFDQVCCIYPTRPLSTANALKTAMMLLEQERSDCVIPVVKFLFSPPQR